MSADLRRLYTPRRSSNRARAGRSLEMVGIEGFAELDRQLTVNLPKATSILVLRRAATTAMKPMLNRAIELAPERTGRTKATIRMIIKKLRANARFGGALRVSIGAGSRDVFWPRFSEHGTVHEPARPFMRPAFDEKSRETLTLLKVELKAEIGKAIARRARRLARLGAR